MTQINYHLLPQIVRFNCSFFFLHLYMLVFISYPWNYSLFSHTLLWRNAIIHPVTSLCSHSHSQLKTCDSGQCSVRNEAKGRAARILTMWAFPELGCFGWRRPYATVGYQKLFRNYPHITLHTLICISIVCITLTTNNYVVHLSCYCALYFLVPRKCKAQAVTDVLIQSFNR